MVFIFEQTNEKESSLLHMAGRVCNIKREVMGIETTCADTKTKTCLMKRNYIMAMASRKKKKKE